MSYEAIEEILDEFDFHRVQQVMKALQWKYYNSDGDYPTIGELRRTARYLLRSVLEDEGTQTVGTGGFEVHREQYAGDPKTYISLKFVVEEYTNAD